MNRSWKVLRTHLARADRPRRSGRAYELLLEWAGPPGRPHTLDPGPGR